MTGETGGGAKPSCTIGTIGPQGVGKTSLTSAITKVLAEEGRATFIPCREIDDSQEERERGVGVFTTRVEYETARRQYVHLDTPAPNNFDRPDQLDLENRTENMFAGARQMDGAILVMSAADSCRFMNTNWVTFAVAAGIPAIVVFMNRMDELPSEDHAPEASQDLGFSDVEYEEMEVRHLLEHQGFPVGGLPIIRGSALAALEDGDPKFGRDAILKLMEAIDDFIPQPAEVSIHWAEDYKPGAD